MNSPEILLTAAVAALLVIGPARTVHADLKAAPVGGEGWVYIDEGIAHVFAEEPAHHFEHAREAFLAGDGKTAASEIRKGAAYSKIEASRALDEVRPALLGATAALEQLADRLDRGEACRIEQLDTAFARTHEVLARHHYLKASQFQARGQSERIWQDLQAATVHLEQGLHRLGTEISAETRKATEAARSLGTRVREGARWSADEVGRAIELLGVEIEQLGKHLEAGDK